jgi:Phycobilisome degradation protein nblA
MNTNPQLSLEQEFSHRSFADQVERMSREQAQEFLIKFHEEMMVRENLYRDMLKSSWGIGKDDWLSDSLYSAS